MNHRLRGRVRTARNAAKENAMTDIPYKLQVKLPNGADFNAEGPQDIVQKAFERFLAITEKAPSTPATPKPKDRPDGRSAGQLDPAILSRAFLADTQKGVVSLRALPPD